jgi:hypothetical protein
MEITVEVVAAAEPGPPAGARVIVQIRDTALQDVAATTIAEKRVTSRKSAAGEPLARAHMKFEKSGGYPTVWVHVDVDESGEVSKGDYITMQSYPVREGGAMRVEVKRV